MKRFLKHNRHQMNDWEKENLWRAIAQKTGQGRAQSGRPVRRSFRPALGLASAVAVLAVAVVWWIDTTDPNRGFIGGEPGVVVRPPEMKQDRMDDRDPAQDARNTRETEARAKLRDLLVDEEVLIEEPAVEAIEETMEEAFVAAAPVQEAPVQEAPTPAEKGMIGFLFGVFWIGVISIFLPCIYPLIPLTVAFFSKHEGSRAEAVTQGPSTR